MKYIQLGIVLTDDLILRSLTFQANDTGLPSNSELALNIAQAIAKSISLNKESVSVQDMLNELNIRIQPEPGSDTTILADLAIAQLTGWHHAKMNGDRILDLIESMGLTYPEWTKIKDQVRWLRESDMDEIEHHLKPPGK